jgi:hypothetical protein
MAFATIGTAGIQAQSVDLSSKVTGTLPVPNGGLGIASGTTDQFLKFTGTTTLASAADNAGSFTKLSTVDISSGDSSVSFNSSIITTTYKQYFFEFTDVRPTGDNVYFKMQESTNNGSSFLENDCDWQFMFQYSTQGNQEFLQNHGTNHTDCQLTNANVGNGANEGISGQMFFSRNGSLPSKANWNLVSTNSNYLQFWSGAMYRDDNGTTNYVRFQMQGTTFISGRITCYGVTT